MSIVAQDECKRGLEHNYQLGLARHIRFHEKILGCAGTLATSTHRIDAMKYAACTKEEVQKIVEKDPRQRRAILLQVVHGGARRRPHEAAA